MHKPAEVTLPSDREVRVTRTVSLALTGMAEGMEYSYTRLDALCEAVG